MTEPEISFHTAWGLAKDREDYCKADWLASQAFLEGTGPCTLEVWIALVAPPEGFERRKLYPWALVESPTPGEVAIQLDIPREDLPAHEPVLSVGYAPEDLVRRAVRGAGHARPGPTRMRSPDAVCPWCGEEQGDTWELRLTDGETADVDCDSCHKPIRVEAHVWIDYTTYARSGETRAISKSANHAKAL